MLHKLVYSLLIVYLATLGGTITPPGADTPEFYLVSSSSQNASNLLPLRTNGGAGGYSTLTGSGSIGAFYFSQGNFVAAPDSGTNLTQRANIGFIPSSTGCTNYGQLGFTTGSSSNKCAQFNGFQIQSNIENSQLGARLTFNFVGGFYACGFQNDVWYQASANSSPPGLSCSPISLYTVPIQ